MGNVIKVKFEEMHEFFASRCEKGEHPISYMSPPGKYRSLENAFGKHLDSLGSIENEYNDIEIFLSAYGKRIVIPISAAENFPRMGAQYTRTKGGVAKAVSHNVMNALCVLMSC